MTWRLVLLTLILAIGPCVVPSFAQTPDEQPVFSDVIESPPPVVESPPPTQPVEESHQPEFTKHEVVDPILVLGDMREAVRTNPDSAEDRLKLAEALYRIGDLDAAIEECRTTIKLKSDHAPAHGLLGVALMAKQDWRAALSSLKEAIRLDPELVQAHYNLGTVLYTTGNLKAAIQSYEQALVLQPHFPDARYRLGLVLKLAHRDQESAEAFADAARGGVPQAQFFLGQAYRTGQGVEKDGALAVHWWAKSAELGHQPAGSAISQLRRQALSPNQPEKKRREALEAFRGYRDKLWHDYPDLRPFEPSDTVGMTLLKQDQVGQAITMLLAEAYALSEPALSQLANIYSTGWDRQYPPFDKRLFTCFETIAADGFLPAKKVLARIYAKGIGIMPDRQKAKDLLKGLPKAEIESVLAD